MTTVRGPDMSGGARVAGLGANIPKDFQGGEVLRAVICTQENARVPRNRAYMGSVILWEHESGARELIYLKPSGGQVTLAMTNAELQSIDTCSGAVQRAARGGQDAPKAAPEAMLGGV